MSQKMLYRRPGQRCEVRWEPSGIYIIIILLSNRFNVQVIVGDQMTCKNIRSARVLMQPEINPINRLNWAHEVPGVDFHFLTVKLLSVCLICIHRGFPFYLGVFACLTFNLLGKCFHSWFIMLSLERGGLPPQS